jgi:hypothetical protein
MPWPLLPRRPRTEGAPPDRAAPSAPPREVLYELARGFLLELRSEDPRSAARFASQFLSERRGAVAPPGAPRPRALRGPLPRATTDGRSLEPAGGG